MNLRISSCLGVTVGCMGRVLLGLGGLGDGKGHVGGDAGFAVAGHGDVVDRGRGGGNDVCSGGLGLVGNGFEPGQGLIGGGDLRGHEALVGLVAIGIAADAFEDFQEGGDGMFESSCLMLEGYSRRVGTDEGRFEAEVGHDASPRAFFDVGTLFGCQGFVSGRVIGDKISAGPKLAKRWVVRCRHGIHTFRCMLPAFSDQTDGGSL